LVVYRMCYGGRAGPSKGIKQMTNEEMKPGRFARWHANRVLVAKINAALEAGQIVQLTTYTHATRYTKKHLGMFKATKSGAYVQRGKRWDCINGCKVTAFTV
jgi:hypothetical protein